MIRCKSCDKLKPEQQFSGEHKSCNPCRTLKQQIRNDAKRREQFRALVSWPVPQ